MLENKKRSKKIVEEKPAFEDREGLRRLVFYTIIVNFGQSGNILKILKRNHSSAQFVKVGEGTATKQIAQILNLEDNRKEIIYTLVNEDYVKDIKMELEAYFAASKRNAGVAYTIDVDSFVGVKLYKFLTQTVRG